MYEIVEKLMKEKGLKTADIVKATGVSYSTMRDWKVGRCTPKSDKRQKIADFFGCSLRYLDTGEEGTTEEEAVAMMHRDTVDGLNIVNLLHSRPELRMLLDAGKQASTENVLLVIQLLQKMQAQNTISK